jgi:hypothetical protein
MSLHQLPTTNFAPTYKYNIDIALPVSPKETTAFATRLQAEEAELVEEAIEATDDNQSAFVRRALEYYIHRNPDNIEVLSPDHSLERFAASLTGPGFE